VQYRFSWGDGSSSAWLQAGTFSASHTWSALGNYMVTAQARSATDIQIVSPESGGVQITVTGGEAVPPCSATTTAETLAGYGHGGYLW
jgi:hypothetical protein